MRFLSFGCVLSVCTLFAAACPAVDFTLANKTAVSADSIVMMKEAPMTFILAKTGNDSHAYRYSEVGFDSLPSGLKQEFNDYTTAQLAKRLVLSKDKWVHRDELLLDADPRYAYAHPLAKFGDAVLKVENKLTEMVTIGVRMEDRGYEMHIDKGKSHGYHIPAGKVTVLLVQESPDGTQLLVEKSAVELKKNDEFTLSIIDSDKVPAGELSTIAIPPEMQVKPTR